MIRSLIKKSINAIKFFIFIFFGLTDLAVSLS